MLSSADQDKLIVIMKAMEEHELAVAELYQTAAVASPSDQAFWNGLAAMEKTHADNLERMIAQVQAKASRFEMGRPFNMAALKTAQEGIRQNISKIARGALSRLQMLVVARDIEQSLIEAQYGSVVKTNDVEYQTLLKEIVDQTYGHRKAIQEQIDKAQKGA
ncbi:MAG: hypothetical protein M0P04_04435 [Syntrophales bacterium]|jgi:rubrerythrin|nr:hypothetical protein [Syntrophales bacterium]MDD4338372.1 hypothetical protein [Syntrophales bacterium]HOG06800.1 hypothetical protein [Syntrophales bacterium]HOS77165.1 hypothetical protein [Syntrophales bacterium]HPB70200.1 hypothetical protein [Syntrophales bacterium]